MAGRPSSYTAEVAREICELLADGQSLVSICARDEAPSYRTVMRWLEAREDFRQSYARARELQAERYAQEIADIADDGSNDFMERKRQDGSTEVVVDHEHIQRSKLRVDTRKWIASKLLPKKYGDSMKLSGDEHAPLNVRVTYKAPSS